MNLRVVTSVISILLLAGMGQSATFTLSGPSQTGNTITVAPGTNFTVNVLMNAPENGNTFEVFLGYDVSSKTTAGLGGTPSVNKLTLVSTLTQIQNSIDTGFTVYKSAKVATAREASNIALGGRPYGLKIVGARSDNTAGGTKTLCSVTFQNNIPAGQSYSIVLSDAASGNSYTSAWKNGITSNRGSYVLTVVSQSSLHPGDANGDGMVDVGDLGILAANYGGSNKTWAQGDFNNDHLVDVGDLGILAANYGYGVNASMDFNADYAKAFGTTVEDDTTDDSSSTSICGVLGLPLIAGLLMAGLMLVSGTRIRE